MSEICTHQLPTADWVPRNIHHRNGPLALCSWYTQFSAARIHSHKSSSPSHKLGPYLQDNSWDKHRCPLRIEPRICNERLNKDLKTTPSRQIISNSWKSESIVAFQLTTVPFGSHSDHFLHPTGRQTQVTLIGISHAIRSTYFRIYHQSLKISSKKGLPNA